MNVKEILHRKPPPALFHYTTQAGLLGIINDKEMWATHTQYLNDPLEFRHAIDIVEEELQKMKALNMEEERLEMLKLMEESIQGIESVNVCVASFSKNGDALSQWRAYSGGAAGFSIEFSGTFLRAAIDDMGWLAPCQYTEAEQRNLVRALLVDVLAEDMSPSEREDQDSDGGRIPSVGNLVWYLSRYAPLIKHQSFEEEEEWRILSKPLYCTDKRFSFRPGISMLVPYYRVPLQAAGHQFEIKRVIVGPTPHPEQSRRAVTSLLLKHGLGKAPVEISGVPYRNW